jgi:hypothetical protein
VLKNIKTKVHPLNKELVDAVRKSLPESEAANIILSPKERLPNEIRMMTYNTQMIPLIPSGRFLSGF